MSPSYSPTPGDASAREYGLGVLACPITKLSNYEKNVIRDNIHGYCHTLGNTEKPTIRYI